MRKITSATIAVVRAITLGTITLGTIATGAAAGAAETGSITGAVVDSSGKALRGAIVSAFNEDQQKSISVLSDPHGKFILDQLPPDAYVVRALLVGYDDTLTDEMDVASAGTGKNLTLKLTPTRDLLKQRTGASLFGMLNIEDEDQRMSFKMSCTY